MAKKQTKKRRRPKLMKVERNCVFCKKDTLPDYKDYKSLAKYLSDRGKILGVSRTGICTKHQRKLTREIKRARYLGLLPYTPEM